MPDAIRCECGELHTIVFREDTSALSVAEVTAQSWRPLMCLCDCGALFRVVGGLWLFSRNVNGETRRIDRR